MPSPWESSTWTMVVMTHYNSSRQTPSGCLICRNVNELGLLGTTGNWNSTMALWSCAECGVCARMCSYVCTVLWLRVSSLWRMNVCACASIAVWVCICLWKRLGICIGSIKSISKPNIFWVDLFMLLFASVTYNVELQPEANCGWHQICAVG